MFRADSMSKDYRDNPAGPPCVSCGKPTLIAGTLECAECWIVTEGIEEHGGEG